VHVNSGDLTNLEGVGAYTAWLKNSSKVPMRRHRINRNFTKPEALQPLIFLPSSFEQVAKPLNISPEEYESSLELKECPTLHEQACAVAQRSSRDEMGTP